MRLDFMCPGESKCGTTTLNSLLVQHPQIFLPVIKEPQWLNNYELCTNRDINWFEKRYYGITEETPQKESMIYGSINPSFGVVPAKRIYDMFGMVKIIFMLRNPVHRLWSHFNHNLNNSTIMVSDAKTESLYRNSKSRQDAFALFCNRNFEKIDGKIRYVGEFNNILSQHRYKTNCEIYRRYFQKENIKIILLEDLARNSQKVCKDLFSFLGVKESGGGYSLRENVGNYNVISEKDYKLLADLEAKRLDLVKNGTDEDVMKILEKQRIIYRRIAKQGNEQKNIPLECVEMLQDYFREDKEYVEEFLQRDLSDIWY